MAEIVLTAVGPDRPGLVDELSGALVEAGGNIADARMINLRGQFAMILLVEAHDPEALERAGREAAARLQLALTAAKQSAGGASASKRPGVPFRLRSYAMDQPGIVHRITHLLHRHGVNIEELQTRLEAGSFSGTPLFTMDLRLHVPAEVGVRKLRTELEQLCDSLNCDVDLEPA